MNAPLRLPLPRDPTTPELARRFVDEALRRWELPVCQDAAMVVVTELVENAIKHTEGECALELHREQATVLISVSDRSPQHPRIPDQSDPLRRHGRGLFMIEAISRAWGVTPTADGKVVWACLTDHAPVHAAGIPADPAATAEGR